ncbi:hypothetical protein P153DRAFT_433141 [Dothidotthia symphoricarpi CBS 119687]|uniref:Uncharacterized protein n=1 Tax=Dothidotthia symphoricarpi CBS 119687 TaxID=1392245 RepID=A0A6A6A945_9PLEO|nr:uncharacterized protein P153DRAFT_433141 [Dothidotthia symphoricarpi CBS 119687]KAF2127358.1 hypothetical protein P153DRAFT_433141 [Dothidotthia symphoricarpi CBS 119687]
MDYPTEKTPPIPPRNPLRLLRAKNPPNTSKTPPKANPPTQSTPTTTTHSAQKHVNSSPTTPTTTPLNALFRRYGIADPTSPRHKDSAEWGSGELSGWTPSPALPRKTSTRKSMHSDKDVDAQRRRQDRAWASEQRRCVHTAGSSPMAGGTESATPTGGVSVSQAGDGDEHEDIQQRSFRAAVVPVHDEHMRIVREISARGDICEAEKQMLLRREEEAYHERIVRVREGMGCAKQQATTLHRVKQQAGKLSRFLLATPSDPDLKTYSRRFPPQDEHERTARVVLQTRDPVLAGTTAVDSRVFSDVERSLEVWGMNTGEVSAFILILHAHTLRAQNRNAPTHRVEKGSKTPGNAMP